MIHSATNHLAEARGAIWRRSDLLTSFFVSTTLHGITCFFSRINNKQVAGFLYSMAESWKNLNLKDAITFSSFSMC